MRKVQLKKEEMSAVYSVLNSPANPQAGLTMREVREISPILEKLEKHSEEQSYEDGSESLSFQDGVVELKEREHTLILDRLKNSGGWANALYVRRIILPLVEKIEEAPNSDNN